MSQEFITFSVSRPLLFYIAAYVQDAAVKAAIAKALTTASPSVEELPVTIHEAQVVTIYNALVNVPAGISAIHNDTIQALIQPYIETNPRMAGMIAEITARSHTAYEQVLQAGEKELQRIVHLMSLN